MFLKILKRYTKKYMCYALDKDFQIQLGIKVDKIIQDDYASLYPSGKLVVKKGYTWNGCSPKFDFLGAVIGTPEGVLNPETGKSKTYIPSLVHDVLYQLNESHPEYMPRKQADVVFLDLLKANGFAARWIYYFVVRLFGRKAWKGNS